MYLVDHLNMFMPLQLTAPNLDKNWTQQWQKEIIDYTVLKPTKDTPNNRLHVYHNLMGKLWGGYLESFHEK